MPRVRKDDVVWVEPKLVAEVEFVEWTHDGRLRAPAYKGLREDKAADEVRREEPSLADRDPQGQARRSSSRTSTSSSGRTRGSRRATCSSYYRDVAPVLVPHLKDRPFTMKRYPDGWQGKFFFQKDAPKHMPDWIPTVAIAVSTRDKPRQRSGSTRRS